MGDPPPLGSLAPAAPYRGLTADFDFELPPERIASEPACPREDARLLQVRGGTLTDNRVRDLPRLLRSGDRLVVNDTRVIPARLFGVIGEGRVEVLLNRREESPDPDVTLWSALARPAKRFRRAARVLFAPDFEAEVLEPRAGGEVLLRFPFSPAETLARVEREGQIPLPPYLVRPEGPTEADRAAYQTLYAVNPGAVAAPTAGLHLTPALFDALAAREIAITTLTLHVGAGTFLPVRVERVAEHIMHAEEGILSPESAEALNATRRAGGRLVAVGTTSLRVLETAADDDGTIRPFAGLTRLFLTPGARIKTAEVLMTNFHLPRSTLLMLVAAFAGLEPMRRAYAHALEQGYRFYSYGDATLWERERASFR